MFKQSGCKDIKAKNLKFVTSSQLLCQLLLHNLIRNFKPFSALKSLYHKLQRRNEEIKPSSYLKDTEK